MMRLFHKFNGNAIIYVIVVLSLISMAIIGFFRVELTLNESARMDIIRKQAEVLAQSAFFRANHLLQTTSPLGSSIFFDESLDQESEIKAIFTPIKERLYLLEAFGQAKQAKHSIVALYVQNKSCHLDISDVNSIYYIDLAKEKFLDYNLKQKKASLYFFERNRIDLGKKANLSLIEDVVLLNTTNKPLEVTLHSPMIADGNLEIFGNLLVKNRLDIKGKLIVHGNIKVKTSNDLEVFDKICLTGELLDFDGNKIEPSNTLTIEGFSDDDADDNFYFIGFRQ